MAAFGGFSRWGEQVRGRDIANPVTEDFGHPAFLGRAGDPSEIGPVIAFLGSKVNSYMTGADVNVDGGSDF